MFSLVAVKVEFSASWFSLSELRHKKKINDTNSRHVETIDLIGRNPSKLKEKVKSQQIKKPNRKRCSKSNNKM